MKVSHIIACAMGMPMAFATLAQGQSCTAGWQPVTACIPGQYGKVYAMTVWDDGSGPALYMGVHSLASGCSPPGGVVRWDGASWTAFGAPVGKGGGDIRALTTFDDGTGHKLFAAGLFSTIDGVPANNIARFDGSKWTPLGEGLTDTGIMFVNTLAVHEDRDGPALYAAGYFHQAGGTPASNIARWDGRSWTALGSGINYPAFCMTGFDGHLYVGGQLTAAGGIPVQQIARWDGVEWSAVGDGLNHLVNTMTVFDDGTGSALYAGGSFTMSGSTPLNRIARWNGSAWSNIPIALSWPNFHSGVWSLAVADDGCGSALYVGGRFTSPYGAGIIRWRRTGWEALGSGIISPGVAVNAMAQFNHDGIPAVYIGGSFQSAGSLPSTGLAKWGQPPTYCYANCDGSSAPPLLSAADLQCFFQRFVSGDAWANCDESTQAPTLNVADFACFVYKYAAGCS